MTAVRVAVLLFSPADLSGDEAQYWDWSRRPDVQFMETVDRADTTWKGNVGVITRLIPTAGIDPERSIVVACGPPIMYKFVLMALAEHDVPHGNIFLNLERKMKCGVGKCGHCQINHAYVCMSGPVFRYSDLASLPEAI